MSPLRRVASMLVLLALLIGVASSPSRTTAAGGIEPSDVVLAFDFSASMKEDGKNVDTASALKTLAENIPNYTNDIITSKITVHLIWFRGSAVPVPRCEELLLNSAEQVQRFAQCLDDIASQYRTSPKEWQTIGTVPGTNYEAAFKKAVDLLYGGTTDRPAIIFFTDGDHTNSDGKAPKDKIWLENINGYLDRLRDKAVLPVGLGVTSEAESDLVVLRDQSDLAPCPGKAGGSISWPTVAFNTGKEAGQRVADAFAAVTCVSVNVKPKAPEAPEPPAVSGGDSSASVTVEKPAENGSPISGYQHECIPTNGGDAVSAESTLPEAQVDGLQNGDEYRCRSAAVNGVGQGDWSEASSAFTPCSGLLGCNPWMIPLLLLLLLLALLAAIALAIWAWRQRTRGYVVASVTGFPQVSLLRGPKTGMSFVSSSTPSEVDGLRRDIQSTSHVAIENLGGGRFKWTDRATSGIAEAGQSFTVTDPTGTQREVKLRAFGGRPKNVQTTVSVPGAAGTSTTATWGSGGSSDGWGGGGSGWDGGGSSSSGGGWG